MATPRSAGTPRVPPLFAQYTPLLERENELRVFESRISSLRSRDGEGGACILVYGEAGAGKTALVNAVREGAGEDIEWLWGACEPLLAAPALGPLIDLLDHLPPSLSQAVRSGHPTPDVLAGMLAMLSNRARPATLVIDDVQWADSATLDLLRYVGRRIQSTRALLVLCWRNDALTADHPLRSLLGSLPTQRTERLALKPLTPQAVAELARRAGRNADGLHAATQGNPFFVTEWLAGDGAQLPEAVRDAVLGRAAPLSALARAVLDLASVAPAGLEVEVIETIIEGGAAALQECAAAGLLQRDGGVVRFRHELARQSVLSTCDASRATALHGAVFDALSMRGGETARLVHHAQHAGLAGAVVRLAPIAAREAAQAGAHRQAVAHYGLALSHTRELDESQRADLYVAHAEACMSMHRLDEAVHSRLQALALHRRLGQQLAEGVDLREIARIEWFRGAIAEGKTHAAAAIAVLSQLPAPRELAMAHATMAQLHLLDKAPAAALQWGLPALDWFESRGDEEGLCYVLNTVATAELTSDDQPAYWQRLERSLDIALRHDLPEPVSRAYANLASMSLVHRRFARLHAVCEAGLAYCDGRDLDMYGARLRNRRACGLIEQGDWPAARIELEHVRATPALSPREDQQSRHLLALLDLRSGNEAVADYWTGMIDGRLALDVDPWYAPQAPTIAEAAWLRGDRAATVRIAETALPAAAGESWRAGQLACWLHRCGRAPMIALDHVAPPCQRELMGDVRGAADAWAKLGCRYDQGLALLGGDEDALREALTVFESLGAAPAARVARQALRALGARDIPRGRYRAARNDPLGLTSREREVLELVRRGLSNRAIAQHLHRSERTVEHHVSALQTKLGASSRGDLAPAEPEK